jgi:hypothetical protein
MSAHLWGAHAYSVLVSAFCGDELQVNVAARRVVSFEKSLRLAKAFGVARSPRRPLPETLSPHHVT